MDSDRARCIVSRDTERLCIWIGIGLYTYMVAMRRQKVGLYLKRCSTVGLHVEINTYV